MKRVLAYLVILLSACVLHADTDDDLILWMVDEPVIRQVDGSTIDSIGDLVGRGGAAEGKTVNAVRVKMVDENGAMSYLGLHRENETGMAWHEYIGLPGKDDMGDAVWMAGPAFADISGYSDSQGDPRISFMIELGNYSETGDWIVLAASERATLGELKENRHIIAGPNDMQGHVEWTGGIYSVPEPSSGLLLLVGGGLLALRRGRGAGCRGESRRRHQEE